MRSRLLRVAWVAGGVKDTDLDITGTAEGNFNARTKRGSEKRTRGPRGGVDSPFLTASLKIKSWIETGRKLGSRKTIRTVISEGASVRGRLMWRQAPPDAA